MTSLWRKRQIKEERMPRPKSEITKNRMFVGLWLTPQQKDMFKDLGGVEWLRNYLNRQIRSEEIQLGIPLRERK
jgi:hypothetical protein